MGLLDLFRREKALTASPAVVEALRDGQYNTYQRLGGVNQQVNAAWLQSQSASYAYLYEHQPAVRTVVDYIARNVAQLGLKLYERASDTDRRLDEDHAAARTMASPNTLDPADAFIRNFVSDYLVHDNAYALKFRGQASGPRTLIRVPAPAVAVNGAGRFTIDSYRIYRADGTHFDVGPEDVIHWRGYNPSDPRIGLSRLETLRLLLAEEAASQSANVELMKSGLAKPGYIKRPIEAPEWSNEARSWFEEDWANRMKSSNRKPPVLEEGMEFADFGVSPKDAQMLDGRRFTREEVARVYGMENCPPSDEDERKAFYADVLPPLTESLAAQLDLSLLRQEYSEDGHYFEFNLNEKLRGDPVQRFQAITAATGAPWLTRNEARALENKPPVDGGEELITPLNVLVGNNPRPAPNVMPPQDPQGPDQSGARREVEASSPPSGKALMIPRRQALADRRNRYAGEFETLLRSFYSRQERVLSSRKATFDSERWNTELAADLEKLLRSTTEREGLAAAARLGLADYDAGQTIRYLRAAAEGAARDINEATRLALADGELKEVFERARNERAIAGAMSFATKATSFAHLEAARQGPDADSRMKTWIVTSGNSAHPEMDGETVPLGETFSNGAIGPPAEHGGCQCILEIV